MLIAALLLHDIFPRSSPVDLLALVLVSAAVAAAGFVWPTAQRDVRVSWIRRLPWSIPAAAFLLGLVSAILLEAGFLAVPAAAVLMPGFILYFIMAVTGIAPEIKAGTAELGVLVMLSSVVWSVLGTLLWGMGVLLRSRVRRGWHPG